MKNWLLLTVLYLFAIPLSAQTEIGSTTYDLQTNLSVCRRVYVENTGTIHATWVHSTSGDQAAADRGTGYNISTDNGTTWMPTPTARIEGSLRTGWPNLGVTAGGRVYSITHTASQGMNFCYKDPGVDWTNFIAGVALGDLTGLWPRAANDGNNIYVIMSRQGNMSGGVDGNLLFYRSFDGGNTWDAPFELPDLGSHFTQIPPDSYAIDASGSNVAIAIGHIASRLVVYKSNNYGNSWQQFIVVNTSNPFIDTNTGLGNELKPVLTSGGQLSVLIDNMGKTHLWTDRIWTYKAPDIEGGPFHLPASGAGLMYWNEDMTTPTTIGQTVRQDFDQNGATTPGAAGIPAFVTNSYGYTMVGQPSAGIDDEGNLYVAYSSLNDGDYQTPQPIPAKLYRDIYLIKSTDNGVSWIGPYNVSASPDEEDVYPAIGRRVTNKVHIIWQNDLLAGLFWPNPADTQPAPSSIYYRGIPVEDIITSLPLVNTPPLLFALLPGATTQNCPLTPAHFLAEAIDYPDGSITNNIIISGADSNTPGTYTAILSITDANGNTIAPDSLLAIVYPDTIAPAISGNPSQYTYNEETAELTLSSLFFLTDTLAIIQGSSFTDLGAATWDISDNVYGCPVVLNISNNVNINVPGIYTIQYVAEDVAGNVSDTITRIVEVLTADLIPPQIILYDYEGNIVTESDTLFINVEMGGIWVEPGYLAYDNVDGLLTDNVMVDAGTVDIEYIGTYTIYYYVEDAAGNGATATRVVKVADLIPPTITLSGPDTVFITCGTNYDPSIPYATIGSGGEPAGFMAFDNVDGYISNYVLVDTDNFCAYCSGTYTITYNVTDVAGNIAETQTRTVIVLPGCSEECYFTYCTNAVHDNNSIANDVAISPNPSKGTVNVSITNVPGMADVRVYNTTGQLLNNQQTGIGTLSLNLSQNAAGMYFVEVTTQQGTVTKSVVIEK